MNTCSRTTRLQYAWRAAQLALVSLLFISCGKIANQHKSISPDDDFLSSKEILNLLKRCDTTDISGCSDIDVGGSAVNSSFRFSDLYTSCSQSEEGLSVYIKNDEVSPTFQMGINFYQTIPTSQTYICLGPEYAETTPTYILKESYCTVQAQVHNVAFSANDQETCEVKITGQSPIAGTVECSQLTTGRFYVSLTKTSRFSCPSKTEKMFEDAIAEHPSFVQTEVNVAGTEAKSELAAQIVSYDLIVDGCASGFTETFTYETASEPKLLNLTEGDTGCVAKLTGFVYKSGATEETFTPADGVALAGEKGTRKNFANSAGSKLFSVSIGSALRDTLLHNELASFFVRPPLGSIGDLFYSATGDFVADTQIAPQVTIASFKDLGISAGKRDAALILDCTSPVLLSMCNEQNILNYRARIVPMANLTPTRAEVVASMQDINTQLRPTVAHLYANGLRFVVSFDATDAATKEYLLIVQHGNSYRYFVFSRTLFVANE